MQCEKDPLGQQPLFYATQKAVATHPLIFFSCFESSKLLGFDLKQSVQQYSAIIEFKLETHW